MQMLVMVLNKVDELEDILEEFNNIGIEEATVLDSQSMANVISSTHHERIPIFGSLSMLISEKRPYSKTIFAVIKDNQVKDAINAIRSVVGDLSKPNVGIVFTIAVGYVEGVSFK